MRLSVPERETQHLYLRGLEEEDVCDIHAYYALEEVTRYLRFPAFTDIDQTLHMLRQFYLPYEQRQEVQTWCLIDKDTGILIGHMNLHEIEEDSAQLAYVLHPHYWGKGLLQEALPQMLEVGFHQLCLHRITALTALENKRSIHTLEHLGMRLEGTMKQAMKLSDGSYHDMLLYAILEDEWRKLYE